MTWADVRFHKLCLDFTSYLAPNENNTVPLNLSHFSCLVVGGALSPWRTSAPVPKWWHETSLFPQYCLLSCARSPVGPEILYTRQGRWKWARTQGRVEEGEERATGSVCPHFLDYRHPETQQSGKPTDILDTSSHQGVEVLSIIPVCCAGGWPLGVTLSPCLFTSFCRLSGIC